MLPEGGWIARAARSGQGNCSPRCRTRAGTGFSLQCSGNTRASRDELIDALHSGKAKIFEHLHHRTETWADIGTIGWLVTRRSRTRCRGCRCSATPGRIARR